MSVRRNLTVVGLTLLAGATAPSAAGAQNEGDLAAYIAMVWTHQGALPPEVYGVPSRAVGFAARYGSIAPWGAGDDQFTNLGISADFQAGARSRFGVTAGSVQSDCDDCDAFFNFGADLETSLQSWTLPGYALELRIKPAVGFTPGPDGADVTAMTASVGLPLLLRSGNEIVVTPYAVPAIGFGRLSNGEESESGVRFLFGAGVRIESARHGVGALAGLQKVFIEDGEMTVGVGLTFTPGGLAR